MNQKGKESTTAERQQLVNGTNCVCNKVCFQCSYCLHLMIPLETRLTYSAFIDSVTKRFLAI